ncbi:hypothetical protein SEHO0A_03716 [Salmonella enterica subsp. houtenae str. ATCC BAA-1581]|nr:hypothetical protein SEHO0A_03716 [Salmonella enterica subsp. houtenae str. ATCC BAA-1581]
MTIAAKKYPFSLNVWQAGHNPTKYTTAPTANIPKLNARFPRVTLSSISLSLWLSETH